MSTGRVSRMVRVTVVACALTASTPTAAAVASVTAAVKKPAVAEVRVVQLYAPADGSHPTLVVVDNQASPGKKLPKPLIEAEFGDVSEFTKVPTGHTLRLGLADDDSGIFIDPLKKGDRITVIPFATSSDPDSSSFQMETIVERGKRQKTGDVAEWPKVSSARATLMMFPGPLLSVAPDFGGFLVAAGAGCVESVDPSDQDLGVGGTIPAFYVVDAGAVDVGLADQGCDAAADIGPETVDAAAGNRIALIPYGTSEDDLQLLVLPVDTP